MASSRQAEATRVPRVPFQTRISPALHTDKVCASTEPTVSSAMTPRCWPKRKLPRPSPKGRGRAKLVGRAPHPPLKASDKQRRLVLGNFPVSRAWPGQATEPHPVSLALCTLHHATLNTNKMSRTLEMTTMTHTASRQLNTDHKTTCHGKFPLQAKRTTYVATTHARRTKSRHNTLGRVISTSTSTQPSTRERSLMCILGPTSLKNTHLTRTRGKPGSWKNTHHCNGRENTLHSGTPSRTRKPGVGYTQNE